MTYGWALLVIVVVGAALFALGVLNPATYTKKNCVGFQSFRFEDIQITQTQMKLALQNSGQTVLITNLAVESVDLGTLTGVATAITPQQRFTIGANSTTTKHSGDSFSYAVTVTYDVVGGIPGQKDYATCTGTVV
jgi:hypothetical protein